jgi:exonuclease VII small subunit
MEGYFGELTCAMCSFFAYFFLREIFPSLSKDAAISFSADASLFLVWILPRTRGLKEQRRAARMCLLTTTSCSCWLVMLGNRSSSNVFFEAAFMILLPFVSALMKTAFAYYFRQREIPDSDIQSVNRFFYLHYILVCVGIFSLHYTADIDETKQSLNLLKQSVQNLKQSVQNLEQSVQNLEQSVNKLEQSSSDLRQSMEQSSTRTEHSVENLQVCCHIPVLYHKSELLIVGTFFLSTQAMVALLLNKANITRPS